jgi:hypothetical protein
VYSYEERAPKIGRVLKQNTNNVTHFFPIKYSPLALQESPDVSIQSSPNFSNSGSSPAKSSPVLVQSNKITASDQIETTDIALEWEVDR